MNMCRVWTRAGAGAGAGIGWGGCEQVDSRSARQGRELIEESHKRGATTSNTIINCISEFRLIKLESSICPFRLCQGTKAALSILVMADGRGDLKPPT